MQIFHRQDEWLLLTTLPQHLAQEGKRPRPRCLWTPPSQPRSACLHFEELEEVWSTRFGSYSYFCEAMAYLLNDRLGAVCFRNATLVTDEVKHREGRNSAPIRATVSLKIRHL